MIGNCNVHPKEAADISAIADKTFTVSKPLFNCAGPMCDFGYSSDDAERRRKSMSEAYNYGRRKAKKLLSSMGLEWEES